MNNKKVKDERIRSTHWKARGINLHSSLSFLIYNVLPSGLQCCAVLVRHDIQGPAFNKIILIISTRKVVLILDGKQKHNGLFHHGVMFLQTETQWMRNRIEHVKKFSYSQIAKDIMGCYNLSYWII